MQLVFSGNMEMETLFQRGILIHAHYLQAHQYMRAKKQNEFIRRLHMQLQYKCRFCLVVWFKRELVESTHGTFSQYVILIVAIHWSMHVNSANRTPWIDRRIVQAVVFGCL